ncbi:MULTISPECIES: type IX secretion system membrane protein PorP/SprF [unclassified Flavobacterium]|uniref:PorP/SprF family type IX secretion system membrane protein n=1 Tax=unclassified Flavobacterium TaxID=196869 RepID=UPI001F133959|nr:MULTISPECIES: type IX secretion system membrane protein PorP/SprF [unclassified Flavobacterium]UMY66175.1 type IX secretion system membrane protein PorP/SprF [Flavobacterium sp. HJ-32-4]UMY66269.1 type IX secretion system membrane protein PorP/SprF [Flavobacterium sp. HJ-32-4]
MKKLYLAALAVLLGATGLYAQQDPHYTQYMYNMNVMNPAYAGSKDHLSMGLLYRKQWVNLDGAPETATFSGSLPVGRNVGLGLSVISDKIGPVEEQNAYGDFSYTLRLNGEHRLAFGLKAGATFQRIGLYSDINNGNLPDPSDDAFQENTNNVYLNIGGGLFYYTDHYYLAFSVPNMLKATQLDYNGRKFGSETRHFFLTGGYVFNLSSTVKFKPFAMWKGAFDAPTSVDVSTNFLFNEKFEIGATYRVDDSFGGLVNYAINPNIRIGYAYDHVISDIKTVTTSSHEIILLFDLDFPKKVSRSPRFF